MDRPKDNGSATAANGRRNAITLLDGGTGSELRRRGIDLTGEAWSAAVCLEHAGALREIHREYIEAGADVITANTFAATRFVLESAGLEDRFEIINRTAIDAARRARDSAGNDREIVVAASLSCYPPGNDSTAYPAPATELDDYRESVRLFRAAGAELILVEMMQETVHASLACTAAAESELPFWLGLSCRRGAPGGRLVGFNLPDAGFAETLEHLIGFDPAAVNVMHSPVDVIDAALRIIRGGWSGPFGAYPSIPYADDPEVGLSRENDPVEGRWLRADVSPAELVRHAESWLDAGATVIGGCCGTTPAHIAALRRMIETRRSRATHVEGRLR